MSQLVLGSENPVETGYKRERSDRETVVVEVEGLYSALESANPNDYCPSGYTLDTSSLSTTGDGCGKLSVRCVKYDEGMSFNAVRTTFRIDMMEVTYDLEDHPHIIGGRDIILMWLATSESKRVNGSSYSYEDKNGELQTIANASAIKFCKAYMSGIKTFNRYYPVIEKVSIWKNPPGMSRSGNSFTGGTPAFSSGVGGYNTPPISLSGYSSTNWFKSKDSWVNNADKTWTRTEQWTYTPESSSGQNAWIYNNLS